MLEYDIVYAILESKLPEALDGFDAERISKTLGLKRYYWWKGKEKACGEIPIIIELKPQNRELLLALAEGKPMQKLPI